MKPATSQPDQKNSAAALPSYLQMPAKPLLGDSIEVLQTYYRERIKCFHAMLEHLNVLQDAPEIEFICREIIEGRQKLGELAKKNSFTS